MEDTLRKLLIDDIAGNYIIGKDGYGNVKYHASIDDYTSYYEHDSKTGWESKYLMFTLSDGRMMKLDLLNEMFNPQWESIDYIRYEMVPLKEVNISCFSANDVVGLTVIGFDRKHDAVKFRGVIDKCVIHYDCHFATGEPNHIYSLHMDNGATAKWDALKEAFIPLDECPERLEYKVVETL